MISALKKSVALTILLGVLLCGVYPLAVTLVARTLFLGQAGGSLLERNGRVVGSALIGQRFQGSSYFHPRPSAAGDGYDASNSSGSNLGPTSKTLLERLTQESNHLRRVNPTLSRIPVDLLTASGSGLDPHLTPGGAYAQVARVAKERGIPVADLEALVSRMIEKPTLWILGEQRVNVLSLNLRLDEVFPVSKR